MGKYFSDPKESNADQAGKLCRHQECLQRREDSGVDRRNVGETGYGPKRQVHLDTGKDSYAMAPEGGSEIIRS